MATMNVSLPDQMKEWVEKKAKSGRFSNASDYVRDLIRRDQERGEQFAQLEAMIEEGWESGVSDHTLDEIREISRREASARTRRGV